MKFIDRIKSLSPVDWLLIGCAVSGIVLIAIFAAGMKDKPVTDPEIRVHQLEDSIRFQAGEIKSLHDRNAELSESLKSAMIAADSVSMLYSQKKQANVKIIQNYHRLNTDERVRVFTKVIAGENPN